MILRTQLDKELIHLELSLRASHLSANPFLLCAICDHCLHIEVQSASKALVKAGVCKLGNTTFDQINAQIKLTELFRLGHQLLTSKKDKYA